jgi:hypothetical protein
MVPTPFTFRDLFLWPVHCDPELRFISRGQLDEYSRGQPASSLLNYNKGTFVYAQRSIPAEPSVFIFGNLPDMLFILLSIDPSMTYACTIFLRDTLLLVIAAALYFAGSLIIFDTFFMSSAVTASMLSRTSLVRTLSLSALNSCPWISSCRLHFPDRKYMRFSMFFCFFSSSSSTLFYLWSLFPVLWRDSIIYLSVATPAYILK